MDKHMYVRIFKDNLEQSSPKLIFREGFYFQHDNDLNTKVYQYISHHRVQINSVYSI